MHTASPVAGIPEAEDGRASIASLMKELRGETLDWALPAVAAAGVGLIVVAARARDPLELDLPGLALFLLSGLAWSLSRRHALAVWSLAGACAALIVVLAVGPRPVALYLLCIPAGLVAVCAGDRSGLAAAALFSLFLADFSPAAAQADAAERITTGVLIWSVTGLIWLSHRPLLGVLEWSWSMYHTGQRKLEQARDDRVHLHEALADLAAANATLTKLKQSAQAMQEAAEEARRAKEQFVANVSHELRTPLNMIVGFCELITDTPEMYGADIPPALLADLDVVLRNGQHLAALIDDVLDLSQIDAQRVALVKERLDLAETIAAAAEAVQPLYHSKGLYLKAELPPELAAAYADRVRVRQVVLNLLSNAGRFTDEGGVTVRARQEGNHVRIAVEDTGPGIAPADAERLFEPFQQLDGSLRRRHGGSGLGLSISRAFIELHGGRLWVESAAGKGSTFYFTLPISPQAPPPSTAARWLNPHQPYAPRTRPFAGPRPVVRPHLVVVEAGRSLTGFLRRHMQDMEIVPAASLEEGIAQCNRLPPQALLVNSTAVTGALEEAARYDTLPPNLPVIACSVPGAAEAAGELGLRGYLVKPIGKQKLLSTLDELDLPNRTVLVIDDEPEVQRLFRRILLSATPPYRVARASGGRQGLEAMRGQRPDVVLLDLVMPDMDGFAFLEAKNQDSALSAIPVVAISAQDPTGQPFVSKLVGVTSAHGMTASQLLFLIDRICQAFLSRREPNAV